MSEYKYKSEDLIDVTGAKLSPGNPALCQGNGKHPEFECCCDECNFMGLCIANPDFYNK